MKVYKASIPGEALISGFLPADYSDTYVCEISDGFDLSPDDIQVGFWIKMPGWVNCLMKMRNILVKPFGLRSGGRDIIRFEEAIRNGTDYGLVSFPVKSPSETVMSLDDKHLRAYLSVYIEQDVTARTRRVYITTLVQYYNKLGRFYFTAIRPFHEVIVKSVFLRTLRICLK